MRLTLIILLLGTILLSACARSDREHLPAEEMFMGVVPYDQFKPVPYRKRAFDYMPAGEGSYEEGYQAGCKLMESAVAEGLYRLQTSKVDSEKLTNDPWYLRGYEDGSAACTNNFDWELK